MSGVQEKFATQVDKEVLDALRDLAREEGKELQSVVVDALKAHVERHLKPRPRGHVLEAYRTSLGIYHSLYQKLAK
jgi:hypothetical protein